MAETKPPEPGPGCDYCEGSNPPGTVLYFGNAPFAAVKSCPRCGSGEIIAPTIIPCVVATHDDEVPNAVA